MTCCVNIMGAADFAIVSVSHHRSKGGGGAKRGGLTNQIRR